MNSESENYDFFCKYLYANGLRTTPQRRKIMEIFLQGKGHLTTEELYDRVREEDSSVGQATVYRTLKLMRDAGLAHEVHFEDGLTRYEVPGEHHHDHLICTRCGKNIEFEDSEIELLQEKLAKHNGFILTSHRMVLFGLCSDCRAS